MSTPKTEPTLLYKSIGLRPTPNRNEMLDLVGTQHFSDGSVRHVVLKAAMVYWDAEQSFIQAASEHVFEPAGLGGPSSVMP